ncbi:MAG: hypothetical protein ACK4WH_02895 [Phycisphaerales bacterium]
MNTTNRSFAALCASILLSAPAALAQNDTNSPLKGPEVTDRPATKGKSGFVTGKPGGKARPRPPVPMAAFTKALASADLTPEQNAKARSLTAEYEDALAAFERKHKAEIEANRATLSEQDRQALDRMLASGRPLKVSKDGFAGAGGGKGKAPAKARPGEDAEPMSDRPAPKPSSPEASEARAKLIEIYSQRPAAGETQAKILALLNEKQAEKVEAAIKQSAPARRGGEGKTPARGKGKGGDKTPGAGRP